MTALAARVQNFTPSATMAMSSLAARLRAEGREIVSLANGLPDFSTEDFVKEAGIQAIRDNFLTYTDGAGTLDLRKALANKLRDHNALDFAPDQILVAPGTKPLLSAAITAVADAGDEGIVPAPYWVSYPEIMKLAGVTPIFVDTSPAAGFLLQPAALEAAITPRTRVMVLNCPNNPTGAVYGADDLRGLIDVLHRHPDVWVVTDEIYEHLTYSGVRPVSIASLDPEIAQRTITIGGFSKGYAMPGWRMGYAGGPKAAIRAMAGITGHLIGSPNSISQKAAVAALTGDQSYLEEHARSYEARRDMAAAAINQMPGLSCRVTNGAFYLYVDCAGMIGKTLPGGKVIETDDDFVMGAMEQAGVLMIPGSAFGMSPYFRLSYSAPPDELRKALEWLRRFCNSIA